MPTYEYVCDNKHGYVEKRSMTEPQRRERCPECDSKLKRKFEPSPIQFRGKGFYKTGG